MRICFIADANHPNTLNWVNYFATDLGHEVHLISLNKPQLTDSDVSFHHLDLPIKNKIRYLFPISPLNKIIGKILPDVVVGYRLNSYAFMAAKTGFHPLIVAAQSQKAAGNFRVIRKPFQWLAAKYALRHADLALAWGPHIARDIISLGGNKNKIFTLPRGVDLRRFNFKPRKKSVGLYIVTTRGLNPGYNLKVVFQAVAKLSQKVDDLKYFVIGDGVERESLVQMSKSLDIENQVEFIGRVSYDSIYEYLCRSDLYISPVPEDGVSSSLLEAIAAGVFPIVADIEANRYWLSLGCKFLLFNPYSVDHLVDKILEYQSKREEFKKHLAGNREVVKKNASWVDNMKSLEQAFAQLVMERESIR